MHEREADDDPAHVESGAKYLFALLVLLALTVLTFGLHYVELGGAGPPVAFMIAGLKVVTVGLIFMELRESLAATRMIAVVTILFVALLCFGILGDVVFR